MSEVKDDTISRQATIANAISGRTREIDGEKWIRVSEVRESIKTLPSTERHGRWKKCKKSAFFPDDDIFTCSECFHNYFKRTNYCPNCGAKMEGEQNE